MNINDQYNHQTWKCKRCGEIVDMEHMRCGCAVSPSPWEPVLYGDTKGTYAEPEELCPKCNSPIHPCLPCEEVVMLNGNHTDDTYKNLLKLILEEGRRKKNRTGVDTIGVFGAQAKFDVNMDAFPILTTKKVWFKSIVHELLWFLRGDTNIKYLVDNDVHIWDKWAFSKFKKMAPPEVQALFPNQETFISQIKNNKPDESFVQVWGDLGEGTYGGMWRAFPYPKLTYDDGKVGVANEYEIGEVDQIQKVIDKLKTNPDDRRMIVSAWHPYWAENCALSPCHCFMQFNTEELTLEERYEIYSKGWNVKEAKKLWAGTDEHTALDEHCIPRRRLNILMLQRSVDSGLGLPFNLTSYSLLLAMVAHVSGMESGTFTHTYGDLHIYVNHIDALKEQLTRTPKTLPKLWLNPKVKNLFNFKFEDIKLIGYESHPAIKLDIAV